MRRAKNFKVKLELKNKRGERLFNKRPAVLAYAFLAAGIWAASAALWNYRARTIMALVALVVSAAMLALKKKGLAVLCGFFLLGELLFAGTADVYESRTFDAEGAEVAARIVSDYDMAQSRYHYVADNVYVNGKKVKGKIVVSYTEGNLPLGAVVKFSADVKSRKFSTHWNSVNNFRKKEYYSATTDSVEIAEITSVPIYDKMRYEIKKNLYTTLRSDTADIITPLLLGDTRVINDNLRHDVSAAGLAHLFAVSGLHIGFLAGVVSWVMKKLRTGYLTNVLVTNAVLLFYAGLCCWSSSIIRAIVMFDVYAVGKLMGVKNDPLSSLAVAGIVVLTLFPEDLLRVGYHMSMLAVAGLCFYTRGKKVKKRNPFAETLSTSLAVNVTMFPVIASAFSKVSPLGIVSNVLILPIASFMYVFVFVNSFLVLLMPFLRPTLYLSALAVMPIKILVAIVGQLNFGQIAVPAFGYGMALYYLGIAVGSRFLNVSKKVKMPTAAAMIVSSLLVAVLT